MGQCQGGYQPAGGLLQEAQVAARPFRIKDINNAVFGQLDI